MEDEYIMNTKSKSFAVRCNEELYNKVNQAATEADISITEYVRRVVDKSVSNPNQEISESSTNEYALNILAEQMQAKDQQIEKLQQALDQEQQLHAVSQKTIESQLSQIESHQQPRPLLARLKSVFTAN